MNRLIGKTIESVEYCDPWDEGFHLIFTDGTCLSVFERLQANMGTTGEIQVIYEGDVIEPTET
jgi:hypothetical protein